jgi:hypothetical protein
VAFAEQKNGVLIKPKRAVPSDDTLSPEAPKIMRRGEAHLKRGESKSWRAVKHALSRSTFSISRTVAFQVPAQGAGTDRASHRRA